MAAEVLDRVRQREPGFLVRLVLAVLTAMGYGLDRIYVQAKRYAAERAVGRQRAAEDFFDEN